VLEAGSQDDNPVIFWIDIVGYRKNRAVNRTCLVLALAFVPVFALAGPAAAHVAIPDVAYYRTAITQVTPAQPQVTVRVDPRGDWIELTNTGPVDVTVLGYGREPYLKVSAGGVEENELSPTTYLNHAMFTELPATATPDRAQPRWDPIASTGTARWHDHRIHWMGQSPPRDVAVDPGRAHLVGTWTIHALAGSTPFEIDGTLSWIGKPGRLPGDAWLVITLANLPFVLGALIWKLRPRRRLRSAFPGRRKRSPHSEKLPGQHADVGLIGKQPVDAGAQEGELLVDGPTVGVGVGTDLQVDRQELVLGPERVRVEHQTGGVGVGDQ
jgi:hypothetical protein